VARTTSSGGAAGGLVRPVANGLPGTLRTPASAPGCRRAVTDCRCFARPGRPNFDAFPLAQLYLLDHEFAAEIDIRTMDGVIRLGWAKDETGRYSDRWPSS
jgi:hypothetical protein